jgi:hypothetical protein
LLNSARKQLGGILVFVSLVFRLFELQFEGGNFASHCFLAFRIWRSFSKQSSPHTAHPQLSGVSGDFQTQREPAWPSVIGAAEPTPLVCSSSYAVISCAGRAERLIELGPDAQLLLAELLVFLL